jgi:hypothetical protein
MSCVESYGRRGICMGGCGQKPSGKKGQANAQGQELHGGVFG